MKLIYNKHLKATKHLPDKEEDLSKLIDVKGIKAQGNQLSKLKIKDIALVTSEDDEAWPEVNSSVAGEDFDAGDSDSDSSEKGIKIDSSTKKTVSGNNQKQPKTENVVGSTNTEESVVVEFEVDAKNTSKSTSKDDGTNSDSEDDSQPTLF